MYVKYVVQRSTVYQPIHGQEGTVVVPLFR